MKTQFEYFIAYIKLIVVVLTTLVLLACPNTINDKTLIQISDSSDPELIITTPENNSDYSQTVTVSGTVTDSGGSIKGLSYKVSGTLGVLEENNISNEQINENGDFTFQFTTLDYNGPIVLDITAEDWNDNFRYTSIILNDPGSAISSFVAEPDNKKVSLSWDAVPNTTSYTIYYTSDGTLPSENYGQSISTTSTNYLIEGLKNGSLITLLLKADTSGENVYWSDYIEVIPLSEFTLAPLVEGSYREIKLEWSEIEGIDEFEVLRSTNKDGPYSSYSGVISGYSYIDTAVSDNQWYYYKVRPNLAGSLTSTFNGAQTFQVPTIQNRISSISTPSSTDKVRISGNYAYIASGTGGIQIINISNPGAPSYITSISTTNAKDLTIEGDVIFLADGSGGIKSFDISTPSSPVLLDTYIGTIGEAEVVSVANDTAFILDTSGTSSIQAIDISDESNLSHIANYGDGTYTFEDVEAVTYSNPIYTIIYVTTGNDDILLRAYLDGSSFSNWGNYTDAGYLSKKVTVTDNFVYILGLAKFDLEPPPEYALIILDRFGSFLKLGESAVSSGYVSDIKVFSDKAYIVDEIGLRTYDVSDETSPMEIDYLNTPAAPTGVDTEGSYAYVATGVGLFQTVDLNIPLAPETKGIYSDDGVLGAEIRENFIYAVLTGTPRFQIVDINNISAPTERGSISLTAPKDVALSGNYAIIVESGLKIIDISDPDIPVQISEIPPITGYIKRIDVKGDYAYTATSTGMHIFDISDPINPVGIGLFDALATGGMNDIAIRGKYVYALEGGYFQPTSLNIVDISDPYLPALVDKTLTSSSMQPNKVSLKGNYAYVTDDFPGQGLFSINIEPSSGSYLSVYGPLDTGGSPKGLKTMGGYAYISDSGTGKGLVVADISDPTNPSLLVNKDLGSTSETDILINGKYAYVLDSTTGMTILKLF